MKQNIVETTTRTMLTCAGVAASALALTFALGGTAYAVEGPQYELHELEKDPIQAESIHDRLAAASESGSGAISALSLDDEDAVPSSYDSRDYGLVTSVKNQSVLGVCWSFAATSMLESSVLSNTEADEQGGSANANETELAPTAETLDLSEYQFAYFFYHRVCDRLGGTAGDTTYAVGTKKQSSWSHDGNVASAIFNMMTWQGGGDETIAPYEDALQAYDDNNSLATEADVANFDADTALDESLAYECEAYVRNAYWISFADVTEVKQAIMEYGSVGAMMYYDASCFNYDTGACYGTTHDTNHVVTIVGWDDDYAVENFGNPYSENPKRPTNPGAWLVKNSWGSSWANDGYFWISYEDELMSTTGGYTAYAIDAYSEPVADNNYQYDGSAVAWYYNWVNNGGSIADVFTAHANEGGYEELNAVSFALSSSLVDYSIQVYLDPTDANDPTSGRAALEEPVTGTTTFVGWYTVELPETIALSEGQTYSVVITLSNETDERIKYFVDATTSSSWIGSTSAVTAGQSFELDDPSDTWRDLSGVIDSGTGDKSKCCARIKAYTNNEELIEIADDDVAIDATSFTYSGAAQAPGVTVAVDGETLTQGTDYAVALYRKAATGTLTKVASAIDGGTYVARVTGAGIYGGTVDKEFTINAVYLKSMTLSASSAVYNGMYQTPTVTVTGLGGKALTKGTDYTVTITNMATGKVVAGCLNAYRFKVTVTGKGSYKGTFVRYYTITKAAQKIIYDAAMATKTYTTASGVKAATSKFTMGSALGLSSVGTRSYVRKSVTATSGSAMTAAQAAKYITVTSGGTVTVAKGLKAGTYYMKVTTTAAETLNFKATGNYVFTIKVVVK